MKSQLLSLADPGGAPDASPPPSKHPNYFIFTY